MQPNWTKQVEDTQREATSAVESAAQQAASLPQYTEYAAAVAATNARQEDYMRALRPASEASVGAHQEALRRLENKEAETRTALEQRLTADGATGAPLDAVMKAIDAATFEAAKAGYSRNA